MHAPPAGFTDEDLAALLVDAYGMAAPVVSHLPVGFGSHNYRVTDGDGGTWFVKADPEPGAARIELLEAVYSAAAELAASGLDFLVAPVPGPRFVHDLAGHGVTVFPFIPGTAVGDGLAYRHSDDLAEVGRMVAGLHAARVPSTLPRDDLAIVDRAGLESSLEELADAWDAGPYSERVRTRLAANAERVAGDLARYDDLVADLDRDGWVVTHGEPHSGNVIRDEDGRLHLADLDTLRVAPHERDLWDFDATPLRPPRPDVLALYELQWALGEIAEFTALLRAPHADDADNAVRWRSLCSYLPAGERH